MAGFRLKPQLSSKPGAGLRLRLSTIALLALTVVGGAQENQGYSIKENDRSVDLSTPYGTKEVQGDVGASSFQYRIEVPIAALKPTPTPTPLPTPTSNGTPAAGPNNGQGQGQGQNNLPQNSQQNTKETLRETIREITHKGDDGDDDDDDDDDDDVGNRNLASLPDLYKLPPPVSTDYDDADRLVLEANHLYNHGKFYEASIYVEELIRKKPTYLRAWIMKGSLMWIQGQKDLAKKAWLQAQTIEPSNREVRDLLQRYR